MADTEELARETALFIAECAWDSFEANGSKRGGTLPHSCWQRIAAAITAAVEAEREANARGCDERGAAAWERCKMARTQIYSLCQEAVAKAHQEDAAAIRNRTHG
jgi:hypothetical protein